MNIPQETDWSWKKLEELLGIQPSPKNLYSDTEIEEIEKAIQHELPDSYIYFVNKWGIGLAFGFFVVWSLHDNPHLDIRMQFPATRKLIEENISMGLWKETNHDMLRQLLPFGTSENGDLLCWDQRTILPNKEMPIFLLGSEQQKIAGVGNSLVDFWGSYCADGRLDAVFPVGEGRKWELPKTFERFR